MSEAYDTAHKKHLTDDDAQKKAEEYTRMRSGVLMPGDEQKSIAIDGNSIYNKYETIQKLTLDTSKMTEGLKELTQSMMPNNIQSPQLPSNQGISVNTPISVEFKGFTSEQISKAIEQAKNTFGQELLTAMQDASSQYGIG